MSKTQIEIIYSDEDIIVVNKPSGVSAAKDRTGSWQLTDFLVEQLGLETVKKLRLIHRLDKGTSGVMILARNKQVQTELTEYFEKRLVKKTYLALVSGVVIGPEGRIEAPLGRSRKNTNLMCIDNKKGKESITDWKLLSDFEVGCLLAVRPLTGRTHQIRVHLPSIGLPLMIDPVYGNSRPIFLSDFKADYRLGKDKKEKPLIERLTLHAYQIELPKSKQNRPDVFIAGLDKKFTATLKMLTKHNLKGISAFVDEEDFDKIINYQRL